MTTIYLATNNTHKVIELSELFAREKLPVEVQSPAALGGMPDVEETETSFEGNATLKVAALASKVGKGNFALADDSGLEVDALDGAPGVYSSRYAGLDADDKSNLEKLLERMSDVPDGQRGAQFACSLVLMDASGNKTSFFGICRGRIIREVRGNQGFGYDPCFVPDGYEQSFGELGSEVKSELSHRARAVKQLVEWLRDRC